jgi:hypothetical protein
MGLSMIFIIVDILSVTPVIPIGVINPFWKFAFVFKCFTDSIILDDFRAALEKLSRRRMAQILPFDILGDDAVPGPEESFVGGSQRERNRHRVHVGSLDEQSIAEMGRISSGKPCIEHSDAGDLSPPSPVRVHHLAHNSL